MEIGTHLQNRSHVQKKYGSNCDETLDFGRGNACFTIFRLIAAYPITPYHSIEDFIAKLECYFRYLGCKLRIFIENIDFLLKILLKSLDSLGK